MNIVLNDQELADIMAFLMTLKQDIDPKIYEKAKAEAGSFE
jgi:hypothetical protein